MEKGTERLGGAQKHHKYTKYRCAKSISFSFAKALHKDLTTVSDTHQNHKKFRGWVLMAQSSSDVN